MKDTTWILIDTETTGLKQPIYAVELAAQKMRGWEREGESFRRLLNHNCSIPSEATRVNGYTPEILERDGEPPLEVYEAFENYSRDLPVVAYNLAYDWDKVLMPEWKRLDISPIGEQGFCALALAQRLLDPVPAGNCKLQTLRQYYRLPERGAHTALGDVDTVIDLMQGVLRPIALERGLDSWEKIKAYTQEAWYPARIPFGQFKGRSYHEAAEDQDLRAWLDWLASSSNQRSSRMGMWYIGRLESGAAAEDSAIMEMVSEPDGDGSSVGLVLYQHPEVPHFQKLIKAARARLADLELHYSVEKAKVDAIRSQLFGALRPLYQERDRLRLLIQYRNTFIDLLLSEGEEAAEQATNDYERESKEQDQEYDSTASSLEGKRELNEEETSRLKQLWKKLVRMFHPDLHEQDAEKKQTYLKLTQVINDAKVRGDIALMEEIARDPQAYIRSQGWASVELDDSLGIRKLRALYEHLEVQILELIESIDALKASPDYELYLLDKIEEGVVGKVIADQREELEATLDALRVEAEQKSREIEELTGQALS